MGVLYMLSMESVGVEAAAAAALLQPGAPKLL